MTTWVKLGLAVTAIGAACWGLSSIEYERYRSLTVLTEWLHDAGPLAPLLLIGSMACAVVIPPIPSLPLDLAAGAVFGPFYGALYALIGAEIGAIGCFCSRAHWAAMPCPSSSRLRRCSARYAQITS
jgi:uncharacterized membrane protein YdjX (TVP38/TMEM64 family)